MNKLNKLNKLNLKYLKKILHLKEFGGSAKSATCYFVTEEKQIKTDSQRSYGWTKPKHALHLQVKSCLQTLISVLMFHP